MKTQIMCCLLAMILGLATSCEPGKSPRSQTQNLRSPSPSGKYVLTVPIEKNTSNPQYSGTSVWKVTIHTDTGALEYKDEESTMVGHLNVYWGWDDVTDHVWLYNSDDGRIHKWTKDNGTWTKILVEGESQRNIPTRILPEYARSEIKDAEQGEEADAE